MLLPFFFGACVIVMTYLLLKRRRGWKTPVASTVSFVAGAASFVLTSQMTVEESAWVVFVYVMTIFVGLLLCDDTDGVRLMGFVLIPFVAMLLVFSAPFVAVGVAAAVCFVLVMIGVAVANPPRRNNS